MSDDIYQLRDNKQLYVCLGVETSATQSEIKRAYHRLAMEFHPDKNPNGADRFKEIGFAYKILSDEEQRRRYDSQKLREHIQKEYDPCMDPFVELSSDQLHAFVNKILREEKDVLRRRQEHEEKRASELKRRETYDRANPSFQMPSVPPVPVSEAFRVKNTSAELYDRFQKAHGTKENSQPDLVDEFARDVLAKTSRGPGSAYKHQMMSEYRSKVAASGVAYRKPPMTTPQRRGKVPFDDPHPAGTTYEADVEVIRMRAANFNYKGFVEMGRKDRDPINHAILADALHEYDPLH